jgi:hypothetical protein
MPELNAISGVEAVWLDYDFVSVTFSINRGEIQSLIEDDSNYQVLVTLLGEAAVQAIRNASDGD